MHLIARRLFVTVTLAAIAGQATPGRLFAQVQNRSYYMEAAGEDIAYSLFVRLRYPQVAKYIGSGSIDDASNFVCVDP